jgi:hypothetical protein
MTRERSARGASCSRPAGPAHRRAAAFLDHLRSRPPSCGGARASAPGTRRRHPDRDIPELSGVLDGPTRRPYRVLTRLGEGGGCRLDAEQVDRSPPCGDQDHQARHGQPRQVLRRFGPNDRRRLLDHPNSARDRRGGGRRGASYSSWSTSGGVTTYCDLGLGIEPRLGLFLQICDAVQRPHEG